MLFEILPGQRLYLMGILVIMSLRSIPSMLVKRETSIDIVTGLNEANACVGGKQYVDNTTCYCEFKTYFSSSASKPGCYGGTEYQSVSGCSCFFDSGRFSGMLTINPQGLNWTLPKQITPDCMLQKNAKIDSIFAWNYLESQIGIWDLRWSNSLREKITYDPVWRFVMFQLSTDAYWDGLLLKIEFERPDPSNTASLPECVLVKFSGRREYPIKEGTSIFQPNPPTTEVQTTAGRLTVGVTNTARTKEPTSTTTSTIVAVKGSRLPAGAIGGGIAGVALIFGICVIVFFAVKRKEKIEENQNTVAGEGRQDSERYKSLHLEGKINLPGTYEGLHENSEENVPLSPVYTRPLSPVYCQADTRIYRELEPSIELSSQHPVHAGSLLDFAYPSPTQYGAEQERSAGESYYSMPIDDITAIYAAVYKEHKQENQHVADQRVIP